MKKSKPFILSLETEMQNAGEGITRQILAFDENIMMVKVMFNKGAVGNKHQHPHVQTTYVVSGQFEVTIDGKSKKLDAGDSFYVEPNVEHGCLCVEEGVLIDVFNPMRQDFL